MCGIVGQLNLNHKKVSEGNIRKMADAIYHRGPDDSGIFVRNHVGIGFRRLSIVDTEGGHQPIYNEDDSILLVTNGEIYNSPDLRIQMVSKGHRFRTKSDIEVILHLYEEYGVQFLDHLNGMFAICLYDIKNDLLILARDRMGIKPLYVLNRTDAVFFGSEIKGILASEGIEKAKENHVLEEFLIFRYLSNNRTFFKNIFSLEPGSMFIVDHGKVRIKSYYELPNTAFLSEENRTLADSIFVKLKEATESQLMSDVPLGTFLSGGIDSSLVTALASAKYPKIKSFTVGFHEKEFDESPFAMNVSKRFHTEYHEIKVDNREFTETLPIAVWHHDEPLNHANSVQIFLISKYARQHVKVLLSGEGSDEVFGGYSRYHIQRLGIRLSCIGNRGKGFLVGLLGFFKNKKVDKIRNLLKYPLDEMIIMNSSSLGKSYWEDLLSLDKSLATVHRKKVFQNFVERSHDPLNRLLFFDQKTGLQSILARADKMSMAASVEVRVPFLDNHVVSLANSMSGTRKIQGTTSKFLLKKSAKKILPTEIVDRKKMGFSNPVAPWLRDSKGLGKYLDMVLADKDIRFNFSAAKLEKIASEHKSAVEDHSEVLWPLINYSIWNDLFFK